MWHAINETTPYYLLLQFVEICLELVVKSELGSYLLYGVNSVVLRQLTVLELRYDILWVDIVKIKS